MNEAWIHSLIEEQTAETLNYHEKAFLQELEALFDTTTNTNSTEARRVGQ